MKIIIHDTKTPDNVLVNLVKAAREINSRNDFKYALLFLEEYRIIFLKRRWYVYSNKNTNQLLATIKLPFLPFLTDGYIKIAWQTISDFVIEEAYGVNKLSEITLGK